jgi:hypothetical protein
MWWLQVISKSCPLTLLSEDKMYNNRHKNNQRAALKYLAKSAYDKQTRKVGIRVKIALFFFSLALASLLHYMRTR